MDVFERAERLHTEAGEVMRILRLEEILSPFSPIYPTGSYLLNLMAYPDLDLNIRKVTVKQLFEIAAQIAECPQVSQVVYEPSDDPSLGNGLYLKPRLRYGGWGRPWKVDIWSLEEGILEDKLEPMRRFARLLTPSLRELILRYKAQVLTPEGRTPRFSGYFIYKAVLDEGLRDYEEITSYLRSNGIQM